MSEYASFTIFIRNMIEDDLIDFFFQPLAKNVMDIHRNRKYKGFTNPTPQGQQVLLKNLPYSWTRSRPNRLRKFPYPSSEQARHWSAALTGHRAHIPLSCLSGDVDLKSQAFLGHKKGREGLQRSTLILDGSTLMDVLSSRGDI